MKIIKIIIAITVSITLFIVLNAYSRINIYEITPSQRSILAQISISPSMVLDNVKNTSFSFAVISDIHSDYQNLERALQKIKADEIDFIIIAGDLTTSGKLNELYSIKEILDKSNMKYYVIPGNHDLWSIKGSNNPFRQVFGNEYQSFIKEGVKFILINNGNGIVGIDKQQEVWLNKEIQDCLKIYCLAFAHMPLNHPFIAHIMGEDSTIVSEQAVNLVKKFKHYQVKELFSGHIHYLGEYTLDGLKTYTTGVIYNENNSSDMNFLEVIVSLPDVKLKTKEVWINQ